MAFIFIEFIESETKSFFLLVKRHLFEKRKKVLSRVPGCVANNFGF
jgi:hypothetical protein